MNTDDDLGLERQVARDQHQRAELADRAGEAERDARRGSPGSRFGRMIRRKIVKLAGAERRGRLLHLAVELDQHRLHRAHDERQRHEQQRQHDADARVGDVDADRARRGP